MAEKLRKAGEKIKKANRGKWKSLSTGEKVIKIVLVLIKIGLICAFGLVAAAVILGCAIAVGIMGGLTGAIDDQIQRSYDYRHRGPYY